MTRTTRNLSTEAARAARRWYIADANGKVLGRLASRLASVLRGRKPTHAFATTDCLHMAFGRGKQFRRVIALMTPINYTDNAAVSK